MSGVKFAVQTSEFTTGTVKLTVLQILAAANHRCTVKEWGVSFDGVSNTDAPILVGVERQSDGGTGGDVITGKKMNDADDEVIQTTALENIDASTAPTTTHELVGEQVHPQAGYTWQAPYGNEIIVEAGGRLAIVVTAGVAVNVKAHFICEE